MYKYFLIGFYFFRPVLSLHVGISIGGVDLFDVITIFICGLMIVKWVAEIGIPKVHLINKVDILILIFTLWCLSIYLVQPERSDIADVIKFTLPPLMYVIIRPFIIDYNHYRSMTFALILGATIPIFISVYKIHTGTGLDVVNYWTKIPRFRGAFLNAHNFGHTMGFFVMVTGIYYVSYRLNKLALKKLTISKHLVLAIVFIFALYCLYESYVRTAYLGFLAFIYVSMYYLNKRLLIKSLIVSVVLFVILLPIIKVIFIDVTETIEGTRNLEYFASGRPFIWAHNLGLFSNMDIPRWLAGVGIGYRKGFGANDIWNSHNDFLEVLIQTGFIGLVIFLIMQYMFYKQIKKRGSRDSYLFLGLFSAVMIMNFMSNSYVDRFSIGQMYYMIMAVIGSKAVCATRKNNINNKKT